jgi:tolkin protein
LNLYLNNDCIVGNIIHELGHVIGFRHTHTRGDRDDHVTIDMNKVSPSYKDQYAKAYDFQPNYYGVEYDLYSIMHYGSDNGIMSAVDSNRNFLMGQRVGLSFLDIETANLAYKCSRKS